MNSAVFHVIHVTTNIAGNYKGGEPRAAAGDHRHANTHQQKQK